MRSINNVRLSIINSDLYYTMITPTQLVFMFVFLQLYLCYNFNYTFHMPKKYQISRDELFFFFQRNSHNDINYALLLVWILINRFISLIY